ncbi:MAG: LysR family transcriptional regulator [Pirellulales bacterium]|nr:LysR family transcriptional regulator [Pirellulales bacterium]
MKLQNLRYFVGIAEHGSFSRAAERMHISQSALSRQMQILENELGVMLFDRIGRRIVLTPAGQDLLARSQTVIHDVEAITTRASELAGGGTGALRLGVTPQTLESLVSRFISHFSGKFPEATITFVEDGSANLIEMVEKGQVDVAIAALPQGSTLESKALFPLAVLCVVPSGHRLKGRTSIRVEDLKDEPLLLLQRQFMTRQLFDGACRLANLKQQILIESNSPHSLLSLVTTQLGIAVVPSTFLLNKLQSNALLLKHQHTPISCSISAIWHPRRYRSSISQAFVDELSCYTRTDYPGSHLLLSDHSASS